MRPSRLAVLASAAALLAATAPAQEAGAFAGRVETIGWPAPTRTNRPWTRWWWLGSAVDAPNIERLLGEYRDAGLGGVEICPIYGAKGYEGRFIDYLSPKWMDMLGVATHAAGSLDLGVDMTTGTGWPMGGPWIPADMASESVVLRRYPIGPDGRLSPSGTITLADLEAHAAVKAGIAGGGNAMDGLMKASGGQFRLVCLMAMGPGNSRVDLTGSVRDGRLSWSAPGEGWSLYSLSAIQPVQKVKRAAPGGAGNVVDPFSTAAIDTYLSRFTEAFRGYSGAPPRAQFHDSYEYFGANWTPDFLGEFSRRRGYDLRERLPELAGEGDPDAAARVREDYRRTIGELHQAYIARWTSWSHAQGSLTREQAHGAPANIEDIYATADIPETEGAFGGVVEDQAPMMKFASSAAHVTGRTLASSETFTWLGEHFQVPLSQLKANVDLFFLTGINHIFFHGIPYSPADAPWPGWLFYAAVNFGPNGGLWHDLPAFNAYATRCQSILQSGRPDNDVLLYFPVADFWQKIGGPQPGAPAGARGPRIDPLVEQFTTPGKWMDGSPFHDAAMELWHKGFAYDEVTDALLAGASVGRSGDAGGPAVILGGNRYRAIVIPPCRLMPVETLRRLVDLARGGATVIFAGGIPEDVPGLADLEARRAELGRIAAEIPVAGAGGARLGAGMVLTGSGSAAGTLSALLATAGVPRETMADDGIFCIRRSREGGFDYFVVNMGAGPVEKWVTLSHSAGSAVLLDPLLPDRMGVAAMRPQGDRTSVFLQMAPGQSLVIRTYDGAAPAGAAWLYLRAKPELARVLGGDWGIHFAEGGPVLPRDYRSFHLGSWTAEEDLAAKRFAGTAVYSLKFVLQPDPSGAQERRLDLGRVADSARVRLNGRDIATLWCAPFGVEVGGFLQPGENTLEIEVTNVA
ncbi:MAG TPA: glycosyl hydrolase, partial [Opitutaceae bacterium]|nr:glycosyl hydrolase [Opitutaceae bacterium]